MLPDGKVLSNKFTPEVIKYIESEDDLIHHFEVLRKFTNYRKLNDILEDGGARYVFEKNNLFIDIYPWAINPTKIYTIFNNMENFSFAENIYIEYNDYSIDSWGSVEYKTTPQKLLNTLKGLKEKK